MKKALQKSIACLLVGTALIGIPVLAKSQTELIEVAYNNIKIFIDGVQIDPKDVTGKEVEPFIYNGTTYLPVRAIGEAIGKTVTWDGTTQSVYLGAKPGEIQYLMDICPPYETNRYQEYTSINGKAFIMAGTKYSNGFTLTNSGGYAIFNLNGNYSSLTLDMGHVDNSGDYNTCISFFCDGKLIEQYDIDPHNLPQNISIPLNNCLQLKITSSNYVADIGFGNIIVK